MTCAISFLLSLFQRTRVRGTRGGGGKSDTARNLKLCAVLTVSFAVRVIAVLQRGGGSACAQMVVSRVAPRRRTARRGRRRRRCRAAPARSERRRFFVGILIGLWSTKRKNERFARAREFCLIVFVRMYVCMYVCIYAYAYVIVLPIRSISE